MGKNERMLSLDEARRILAEHAHPLEAESVPLADALGRVLARDAASDCDLPPFDKAAMDGFALRRDPPVKRYRISGTVSAGDPLPAPVKPGECIRIMTGAPVPPGADLVVRFEYTRESEGTVEVLREEAGSNICPRGEDVRTGDVVLAKGTLLGPQMIGLLAAVGCTRVEVYRRPRVAILSTGDELVEPEESPPPGHIRNSNALQLRAHVLRAGGTPIYKGIARDTRESLREKMGACWDRSDVLVLSGGVSMGDRDLVPGVLREQGVEILFSSIAVKPGRPTLFGVRNGVYVFGLPGNPVSTFVQFEFLIRPFMHLLMGHAYRPPEEKLEAGCDFTSRASKRASVVPVRVSPAGEAVPVEYHGSADIRAYTRADGMLLVEPGRVIRKGDPVRVRRIQP